jgi:hypothetical protein
MMLCTIPVAEMTQIGQGRGGERKEQGRTSFLKKRSKKLLLPTALERPDFGRSKAVGNKSFLVTFFQKSNCFLTS